LASTAASDSADAPGSVAAASNALASASTSAGTPPATVAAAGFDSSRCGGASDGLPITGTNHAEGTLAPVTDAAPGLGTLDPVAGGAVGLDPVTDAVSEADVAAPVTDAVSEADVAPVTDVVAGGAVGLAPVGDVAPVVAVGVAVAAPAAPDTVTPGEGVLPAGASVRVFVVSRPVHGACVGGGVWMTPSPSARASVGAEGVPGEAAASTHPSLHNSSLGFVGYGLAEMGAPVAWACWPAV
jgi:hypothetical protein